MAFTRTLLATLAATSLLTACGTGAEDNAETGFKIVGSSTVYPFAERVAQLYGQANPDLPTPVIRANGTEAGIEEFCTGDGAETPSVLNASARMTAEQLQACEANGVTDIAEIPIGLDGIVFAVSATDGLDLALTPGIIYRALAARPFDNDQDAENWSQVDESLPDEPIIVYGPPETSGTRSSLASLVLESGCATNNRIATLKGTQDAKFTEICDTLREDAGYISQGEKDDVIVRKVAQNPRAVGIFGYSYLEESDGSIKPLAINGVEPNAETIADGSYPASRPLFLYIKKSHIAAQPGLKEYLETWRQNWGRGGELTRIGLVAHTTPFSGDFASASTLTAAALDGGSDQSGAE
ncbi:substrate-binding domain-containing protein [Qipengyuania qiaonensis]|uniref:Substrate-binding domain-containing protein n=1 Tax=Qipengyuania qiaonensis TaxID=2867240 RepID=A0ABS7J3K8_9SPHN|nr:substrate-binding domain-containing protein [Qipengyuania qiaonensis]MBX7481847.1 substrate-binding domain-containing protein [Qipengyuania qiaonensis]